MVDDHFYESNGINCHCRDWGGIGQSLVLLHGLASTSRVWDLVMPYFDKGFHIVALDQRGHGESEKPGWGYNFSQIVDDLHTFTGKLELEQPVLIGHSWGGNIALEYSATYTEQCAAIVLVDGGFLDVGNHPRMAWEQTQSALAPPTFIGVTKQELLEQMQQ